MISCEFCKKEVKQTSLLLHIGRTVNCRAYYGERFDEKKKEKNKTRKRKWRNVNGKRELQKEKELYKDDSSKREKRGQTCQRRKEIF